MRRPGDGGVRSRAPPPVPAAIAPCANAKPKGWHASCVHQHGIRSNDRMSARGTDFLPCDYYHNTLVQDLMLVWW